MNKKEIKSVFKEFCNLLNITAFSQISRNIEDFDSIENFLEYEVENEAVLEALVRYYDNNYQKLLNNIKNSYFKPKFKNVVTGELLSQYDCDMYLIEQEELTKILA